MITANDGWYSGEDVLLRVSGGPETTANAASAHRNVPTGARAANDADPGTQREAVVLILMKISRAVRCDRRA